MLTGSAYRIELIACGEIRLPERSAFADRLARLYDGISEIVARHSPAEAAVEGPFHGISARSALQLAHARGVVLAALGASHVRVFEYSPATIKKAVTGNGRAEKAQVQAMVTRLVSGGALLGGSDVADAVATALCHLSGRGSAGALRKAVAVRRAD